jgi:SAM-dependent methyltransferase
MSSGATRASLQEGVREENIQAFWAAHPCGEELVGDQSTSADYDDFFARYDAFRYGLERHIPRCLDDIEFSGKRVLEIGLGLGADSEQIIRRGARWTGVDLTEESVARVRTRLDVRGLPYEKVVCGSALDLPFRTDSFDIVYSHGVFHHIPDIVTAQTELARVIRPRGEAVLMLYARRSLNYMVSICVLRRLGLVALYPLGGRLSSGIYGRHVDAARRTGLWRYLQMKRFIHRNTDGPENPFSRVYDLATVVRDFPTFDIVHAHKEFMHAPPLPVHGLPFARFAGWHLWVHLRPRKPGRQA